MCNDPAPENYAQSTATVMPCAQKGLWHDSQRSLRGARESCEVRVATICGLVMQCAANCQLLLPYLGMLWRIRRAAGLEGKLDAQL